MEELVKPYGDPRVLLPMGLMFVIIFAVVLSSLRSAGLFPHATRVIVALCISGLAMYGLDRTIVRLVVVPYTAMGVAILISLAAMVLVVWLRLLRRTQRPPGGRDE